MNELRTILRALPAGMILLTNLAIAGAQAPAPAAAPASTDAKQPATTTATTTPAAPKKWYDTITLKGYLQLDATFPDGKNPNGSVSNFRIRRGRPTITAQIDPKTSIQVQLDMSTGKANGGTQSAQVMDTFADHVFNKYVYVRFGQMLLPFSREVHDDNAGIRSPLELSYAASAFALGEHDLGIMLGSQVSEDQKYHWEFGFFNGQAISTADVNANKTWMGRFAVRATPQVRVGIDGVIGKYKDTSGKGSGLTYDRDVLAGEVAVKAMKSLNLAGEFYNCRFVNSVAAPSASARFNGGYLMCESWIGPLKSIPFIRYQRTYGDLEYRSFDLGWRYQYASNQRLTLEYDIVRAASMNAFGARWQINF